MMAVPPLIAALPVAVAQFPPSLALLLLLTGAVLALIYAYHPPLPQTMAFAFLPWVVTGSLLHVLAVDGQYPAYLVPLFTVPGAYVTVVFIPGLVWSAMLNLTVSGRTLPPYHHYIGAMGAGVVVVLWTVLLLDGGLAGLQRMLLLVVVPLAALLAAGIASFTVGLWSPDFVVETPIIGGFVVFAALVNAAATALGVVVLGDAGHTALTAAALELVLGYAPGGLWMVDVTLLWVSLFVLTNALVGVFVAGWLARYADAHPRAVSATLGVLGVVWFGLGFNRLLIVVVS